MSVSETEGETEGESALTRPARPTSIRPPPSSTSMCLTVRKKNSFAASFLRVLCSLFTDRLKNGP